MKADDLFPWKEGAKAVAWLGGASAALSIVLAALGYLGFHAYLNALGVPSDLSGLSQTGYVFEGGRFCFLLAPFLLIGFASPVLLGGKWLAAAPVVGSLCLLGALRRDGRSPAGATLAVLVTLALWVVLVLLILDARSLIQDREVALFTGETSLDREAAPDDGRYLFALWALFTLVLGIYVRLVFAVREHRIRTGARIPLLVTLFVYVLSLPLGYGALVMTTHPRPVANVHVDGSLEYPAALVLAQSSQSLVMLVRKGRAAVIVMIPKEQVSKLEILRREPIWRGGDGRSAPEAKQ